MSLTVSVVVPARDEEARLGGCLRALAAQSEPVDEVIVVDDGSADATADVALEAGALVLAMPRTGIAAARSAGFDAAGGQVIARIDADTLVDPRWAAAIRRAFALDPHLDALAGRTRQAHVPPLLTLASQAGYEAFRLAHRATFGAGTLLYGHNMAIRAATWRRVRDLVTDDDTVSEDVDVALAVQYRGGHVRTVPRVVADVDLVRTLQPAKLARYLERDEQTRRKYRLLGARAGR